MEDIPIYKGIRKNILIISGGGIKGFCALGAIQKLIEKNIIVNPEILCGTSVGGLIAFILNIGYSPYDIFNITSNIDYELLVKIDIESLLEDEIHIGLNSTEPFMIIIKAFMKEKKINTNITFKELFVLTKKKLILTGVCLNDMKLYYFSVDTTPDMEVIIALQITMSIPIVFKPVIYENKIWIDGATINNYPIDYFNDKLEDVIGVFLDEEINIIDNFEDTQSYVLRVFYTAIKGLLNNKIELYKDNTIKIKIPKEYCKWNITDTEKKYMFDIGYNSV
jgi:NTE family protein